MDKPTHKKMRSVDGWVGKIKDKKKEHKLIQSYVLEKYFVSTIYRESSCEIPNIWYYETMVWEWDKETRERGEILLQEDSGMSKNIALGNHNRICLNLLDQSDTN